MSRKLLASLNNVSKIYESGSSAVTAVKGISLDIYQGDFISISGVSGSGKTTLLDIMAGLLEPTSGSIIYNESIDLYKLSDKKRTSFRRRNIGIVFQGMNLLPEMTGKENILFPLLIHKLAIDEDGLTLFRQLLEKLGLESAANRFPYEMSGGEQQRTALARALFPGMFFNKQNTILLADEPSANLDSANVENIGMLLQRLNLERKLTILLATHDIRLAKYAKTHLELINGQLFLNLHHPSLLTANM